MADVLVMFRPQNTLRRPLQSRTSKRVLLEPFDHANPSIAPISANSDNDILAQCATPHYGFSRHMEAANTAEAGTKLYNDPRERYASPERGGSDPA